MLEPELFKLTAYDRSGIPILSLRKLECSEIAGWFVTNFEANNPSEKIVSIKIERD